MKKIFCVLIAAIMSISMLAGCSTNKTVADSADEKLNIVVTIFPEYDWVKNIVGDKANITLLMDNGADLHNYQPSASDIVKIKNADLFIYVGGESDEWVEDIEDDNLNAISLLEIIGDNAKEEELVEGMQGEEEEDDEECDEDEIEYDEHVWLSLRNAKLLCTEIARVMSECSPENASVYKKNLASYLSKLSALDAEYSEAVKNSRVNTLLFGDRFPFRYLVDDYNISYYAAFVGCSAETEASFKTIVFLSNKVDSLMLKSVCTIEKSDGKIARTVIQNSKAKDAKVLAFDSMQSTTSKDFKRGTTYLGIMQNNLAVLKEALK